MLTKLFRKTNQTGRSLISQTIFNFSRQGRDIQTQLPLTHVKATQADRDFTAMMREKGHVKGKVWTNALEALRDLKDGDTIMAGGFGLCGIPENCIKAVANMGTKDLSVISNELGTNEYGLSILLKRNQVSKVWASYIGMN